MSERITMNAISNSVMAANQNTINQLATYQEQLSTGMVVNQPSDNPDASNQSMDYQAQLDANAAFTSNIHSATAAMTDSDSAMTQISQIMSQVQGDAVEGANGTQTASSNQALAQSVNALLGQLISLANTQSNGQYVYAGTATNTKPFALSADGSQVTYQGNLATYSMQIGPNSSLPVNQNG
jgi:flagellar hook-associated protein 3 FlgL